MALGTSGDSSIPSAPAITINATTVVLGANGVLWYSEVFAIGDTTSGAGLVITLAHTPQSAANVNVYQGGLKQRPTTDYTITGAVITLATAMSATDQVLVWYMALVP